MVTAAILPILLQSTGLSQVEAALFCGVQDRGFRRWITGERTTPDDAISKLADLSVLESKLSKTAFEEHWVGDLGLCKIVIVYSKDIDVPRWEGMPYASAHRSVIRRIFEKDPARTIAVAFDRHSYRMWTRKTGHEDSSHERHLWALSVAQKQSESEADSVHLQRCPA